MWRLSALLAVFVVGVLVGAVVLSNNTEFAIESHATPSHTLRATRLSDTLSTSPEATPLPATRPAEYIEEHRDIAEDSDDVSWPLKPISDVPSLGEGTQYKCVSRGMQQKCLFRNLVVKRNSFYVYDPYSTSHSARTFPSLLPVKAGGFPNPLYPPDGQVGPLIQNHKYRGHPVGRVAASDASPPCSRVVTRPTIFVFRMSGHSTYHMWENNLGPFYATLLDNFDLESPQEQHALRDSTLDPKKLLVAFVDKKPRIGPKAPKILDKLLRLFSDTPLLNASRLSESTCFTTAIVGVSANRFPHRALVREGQRRLLGKEQPIVLPEAPNMIYVSRNHERITRGRKMINEAEVFPILNRTMFELVGKPVRKVFMEELTYKEQVQLASETHLLFSPHGGGVANCIWMPPGAVVVEFVAPVGKTLPGMYHTMCGNSGVQHFHFLAEADPNDSSIKENARLFSNLVMPVNRMIENAKKGLAKYQAARRRGQ
jgi:hypothetical protein